MSKSARFNPNGFADEAYAIKCRCTRHKLSDKLNHKIDYTVIK